MAKVKLIRHLNIPISDLMQREIMHLVSKAQKLNPGITKSDWARVIFQREITRRRQNGDMKNFDK